MEEYNYMYKPLVFTVQSIYKSNSIQILVVTFKNIFQMCSFYIYSVCVQIRFHKGKIHTPYHS